MNPLLGFTAARSKGPWGITYRGNAVTGSVASFTTNFDLGIGYADRTVWLACKGATAPAVSSVTVGGVAATLVRSQYKLQWWVARRVPGQVVPIVIGNYLTNASSISVYTVTGALGGANVSPEIQSNENNNDNSVSVIFNARAVGDIFLASGIKQDTNNFTGWTATPLQADIISDINQYYASDDWASGRSVQQTGTASATITSTGSDSSKRQATIVLRFSKAP